MQELKIEVPTEKASMEEARPALDQALRGSFPAGLLKSRWDGETLHLTGPGAAATVRMEDGCLVGRAQLGPPASFMQDAILEKVTSALRRAASGAGHG